MDKEMNLDNKTTDELSLMMDEWSKKIITHDANLALVEETNTIISKDLINVRDELSNLRKNQLDNELMEKKAKHILKKLHSELDEIKRAYWRKRG